MGKYLAILPYNFGIRKYLSKKLCTAKSRLCTGLVHFFLRQGIVRPHELNEPNIDLICNSVRRYACIVTLTKVIVKP